VCDGRDAGEIAECGEEGGTYKCESGRVGGGEDKAEEGLRGLKKVSEKTQNMRARGTGTGRGDASAFRDDVLDISAVDASTTVTSLITDLFSPSSSRAQPSSLASNKALHVDLDTICGEKGSEVTKEHMRKLAEGLEEMMARVGETESGECDLFSLSVAFLDVVNLSNG
jgi:hypothetical protein